MAAQPYNTQMEKILEEIANSGRCPKLLLHACCAPCCSAVLERLSPYFSITVFFDNPNMDTYEEYEKRADELRRLLRDMPLVHEASLIVPDFAPERFSAIAQPLADAPEGGARCSACFHLRLQTSAKLANELGCDYFTTTLSISPHKNATLLNTIGEACAAGGPAKFLPSDFKKRGGFLRSIELSRQYGLYRQDYCGCEYSKR